ncbi:hypothetical protein FB567DRAFT_553302 [Paraphoma chrysanthemicola]|uniref:Uncharacterized protein n=1 Tax=Paraphoma chrysanthemicola TaxID=798071 RepID=A0A8K0QYB8_9PLEO|nr:hypothetical protein FB567DRAFT_553302 [Paraphoma chrysanthemicola]
MSLLEFFALVALLVFLLAGGYVCRLELRVQHLLDLLAVANSLPAGAHPANNTLGDFEALQGPLKTSQDDNSRLRATIRDLAAKNECLSTSLLLSVAHDDPGFRRVSLDEKSASLRSLSAAYSALRRAADLDRVEMDRLQRTISDQTTSLWQRDVIVARFNTVIEFIHQMVAAGGLQMVVTVLFLGLFAYYGGYDLGELEVDTQKFESYFEYARAMADGLPCPLLPQGGFRLSGIQFPLTGVRVVGTRIIQLGNTFLSRSAPFSAGGQGHPAGQDDLPPMPNSPLGNVLDTPPAKKAAVVAAVSATATTTANTTKLAAATPPAAAPPAPPSQPAKAETKNLAFQPSKKPGSFGVQK